MLTIERVTFISSKSFYKRLLLSYPRKRESSRIPQANSRFEFILAIRLFSIEVGQQLDV